MNFVVGMCLLLLEPKMIHCQKTYVEPETKHYAQVKEIEGSKIWISYLLDDGEWTIDLYDWFKHDLAPQVRQIECPESSRSQ